MNAEATITLKGPMLEGVRRSAELNQEYRQIGEINPDNYERARILREGIEELRIKYGLIVEVLVGVADEKAE